ncbi:MAG TPA: histidinol-phosphatase [Solirubrobacteraceae bacterium]
MLTDYHVHLRPDRIPTPPSDYFTSGNADRYRTVASERGIRELGVAEHVHRFTAALDVWQHPMWRENARDDVDAYCGWVKEETDLKLGIEMDFLPGREDRIANLLEDRPWDYVVGSVHFLRDDAVDWEVYDVWDAAWATPDRVWQRYFETMAEAARSGLYDILAHPDLVKVWGGERPWPEGDLRRFYEPLAEAVADTGVAVEVSTAGLRKPVGEIYPSAGLLEMLLDAGAVVALSSDAHAPGDVGAGYEEAEALLDRFGVDRLAVFSERVRTLEPRGADT